MMEEGPILKRRDLESMLDYLIKRLPHCGIAIDQIPQSLSIIPTGGDILKSGGTYSINVVTKEGREAKIRFHVELPT